MASENTLLTPAGKNHADLAKWLTPLLAVFTLLWGLSGCGGGASGGSTNPSLGGSSGGATPLASGTELLYVGDNVGVVHGFAVDPNSGNLTPISTVSVGNQASAGDVGLAADAGGEVLYATSDGLGGPNVASFLVNKTTGTLTVASDLTLSVPPRKVASIGAVYVIPDPSANAAQMFTFGVNGFSGALTQLGPTATLPGPPHDLVVAAFGNNVPSWMGLTLNGTSAGEIQGIVLQSNGGLTMGSPVGSDGTSPQGIQVTPDSKFVVVANQATNNVSVFSLAATNGALTEVAGSPFATGQQPGSVAIDPAPWQGYFVSGGPIPSAKFVFVGNTGENSLSAYTIDSSGSLTPVAGTPIALGTNAQPSSIAVDPAGKFVYVSITPKEIAGFSIDQTTGALTPMTGSPFSLGAVSRDMVFIPGAVH